MSNTHGGDQPPPTGYGNASAQPQAAPQWTGSWAPPTGPTQPWTPPPSQHYGHQPPPLPPQQPQQAPWIATGQQPSPYGPPPGWVAPVPRYPYAPWIRRVAAFLIDFAPSYLAMIPFYVGYVMYIAQLYVTAFDVMDGDQQLTHGWWADDALVWMGVGIALLVPALVWQWYNRWLTAGRTGQSLGKRVLKAKLVGEIGGQPIGPVNAFLRDLLHILDGAVYIGYLWPLWDRKRQTFADQLMKTVVIDLRVDVASTLTSATSGTPSPDNRHW